LQPGDPGPFSNPAHTCSLNTTQLAGFAFGSSTVAFFAAGDFSGRFQALDRSEAQLLGVRQQPNLGTNFIDSRCDHASTP
jgi:hypothetical protein